MSRIIYLIGAGASRGKRGNEKLEYADILSGLPVVNEIPGRLYHLLSFLKEYKNAESRICATRQKLINDLEWLADSSARHTSIDTFAKKLFIGSNWNDYLRLKKALIVFLNYEQLENRPDSRYDSFFASILHDDPYKLPDTINVLSWNYDIQFEIAYNEFCSCNNISRLSRLLGVFDKTTESPGEKPYHLATGFRILKLNGSAYAGYGTEFFNQEKQDIVNILCSIYEHLNEDECHLSFAWEEPKEQFVRRIKDCVSDAIVLVIIGYSFPFFNRSIDRVIVQSMTGLKKIYIQDPNAESVKQNLKSALSPAQITLLNIMDKVDLIPYVDNQFFLPPEL